MNSSVTRTISNGRFYFLSDVHLLEEINEGARGAATDFLTGEHDKKGEMCKIPVCVCSNFFTSNNTTIIIIIIIIIIILINEDVTSPKIMMLLSGSSYCVRADAHNVTPPAWAFAHTSVCVCVCECVCVCDVDHRARALCPSLHLPKPPRLDQGHSSPLLYRGCGSVCTLYRTRISARAFVCVCVCVARCVFFFSSIL